MASIRVLTLSPGRKEDPLRGKLEKCRLHGAVAYDALSYCWGTGGMDAVIYCSRGFIRITKTLERALKVLRYKDKTRRLWIDQICINQQDTAERSSQVRLMYEIYSLAQRTIVWLGDDEKEYGPVVQKLFSDFQAMGVDCRNYGLNITARPAAISMNDLWRLRYHEGAEMDEEDLAMTVNEKTKNFPADDVLDQCKLPRRSSEAWPAFNALLRSRYFTRVWTLQEVLSSKEAVIVWGTTEIPWASLRGAYRWAKLNHCFVKDPRQGSHSPSLERVRFLELELPWFRGLRFRRLVDLVTTARDELQATDPRDHIYAFISLASDGQHFETDYDKSEQEVFRDFSKYCIQNYGYLTMLNLAGLHRDEGFRLPSWVPSWRRLLFWDTPGGDESSAETFNEPLFPLAEDESMDSRPLYNPNSEGLTAHRPEQLLVKGYRLPRDQAKTVCTHQAYSVKNPGFLPIADQYRELCRACESPSTFLREMVDCVTCAERDLESDGVPCDELLAQLISFLFNSMLSEIQQFTSRGIRNRFVPGLQMIGLASDAMGESGVISTRSAFSRLSITTQKWLESLIRGNFTETLGQQEVDKVLKAISTYWSPERASRFDASRVATGHGRKLFVTTQGRVGIGPALMTTTDVIIIAYGGETPYVLRQIPDTQEYLLIGDCYIHNLMDGTATPKEDDPPAEWFCLGGQPRQTVDTAVVSSGIEEVGVIGQQCGAGGF